MRAALLCASSAEKLFLFANRENLRIFPICLFTRGVVEESGSCRAGFLRKHPRGGVPSPSSLRDATAPDRGRFHSTYRQMAKSSSFGGAGCECSEQAERVRFQLNCKVCGFARGSPFEERRPPRRGKMSRSDKRGNLSPQVTERAGPLPVNPPRSGTSFCARRKHHCASTAFLRSRTSFLLAFYVN